MHYKNKRKYYITCHLVDRIRERFPNIVLTWDNKDKLYTELNAMIEKGSEEKSYLNNTEFMLYLQDKYGIDTQYEFRANKENNILFIITKEGDKRIVKTCWALSDSYNVRIRNKFSKKAKKDSKNCINSRALRGPLKECEAMDQYFEMLENNMIDDNALPKLDADGKMIKTQIPIKEEKEETKTKEEKEESKEKKSYCKILRDKDGNLRAIICKKCRSVSYNINDVIYKYCSNCHTYLEEAV